MAGFASYTARSEMRPDIAAGPMGRKCRLSNGPEVAGGAVCPVRPETSDCATAPSTQVARTIRRKRFMWRSWSVGLKGTSATAASFRLEAEATCPGWCGFRLEPEGCARQAVLDGGIIAVP